MTEPNELDEFRQHRKIQDRRWLGYLGCRRPTNGAVLRGESPLQPELIRYASWLGVVRWHHR
jgi:hypothetical protein